MAATRRGCVIPMTPLLKRITLSHNVPEQSRLVEVLGDLRSLATTRFTHNDRRWVVLYRLDDLFAILVHGQTLSLLL